MKKILNIISTAYRATVEEQDDTVIWAVTATKGAGSEMSVLLKGSAINYLVKGQDASGIQFGEWKQTEAPQLDRDVKTMLDKGIEVSYIKEDAESRGMDSSNFIEGVKAVSKSDVVAMCDAHDLVWHW